MMMTVGWFWGGSGGGIVFGLSAGELLVSMADNTARDKA